MNERILLIEDNRANLDLMAYLLKAFGYTVLAAEDGGEGLAAVRRERPDLVLCDIELPVMDGCALAREVKSDPSVRSIPLVAVTAFAMVGDRDRLLGEGFDGYISKPIEPRTFVSQIEEFLKSRSSAPAALTCSQTQPRPAASRKDVRILVVDDQQVNLSLQRSILEPFGYEILTASGMAQGLALARQHHPSLIISDLNMCDGNGFEFVRTTKNDPELKNIPFILMTSTTWSNAAKEEGLSLGAARFIFRPIEPLALLSEIESCLKKPEGS